ncbi:ATP-binding protein [Fibrella aquatilis]|uniref:ATP-binding protein n=1 Tax=Fibrella aquatilis TaxID=2817059 RepID=A0A939GCI7_9BACT|nr:ATP-binding protein [Fibrella aquatilis]MBO0934739.1 ATP-binding protein [Fibrella aquatilis]
MNIPLIDASAGLPIRHIPLTIDYTIIEHFSHHLYGSPNKAIEELVINGFDAFATEVKVFTDGEYTPGRILVLDNGNSMDVDGLSAMWQISKSPKKNNRTVQKGTDIRSVIGKFGIGKVASYTLGNSISHICKKNNEYLAVRMDYKKLMEHENAYIGTSSKDDIQSIEHDYSNGTSATEPKQVNIYSLEKNQAESFIKQAFEKIPDDLNIFLENECWTVAIIEDLKDKKITHGRLAWVLGNAMPLRPDFKVWVDSTPVIATLEKSGIAKSADLGNRELKDSIKRRWEDYVTKKLLSGDLIFDEEMGLDPNNPGKTISYIEFPNLGKVWGKVILYNESIKNQDSSEAQRSYGFFIMVLGRLLNDNDPKFLLNDPSFGTFYKSQYILNVDGLDEDLLADRERIHRGTDKAEELAFLQHAIYLVTTNWQADLDDQRAEEESTTLLNSIPINSREFFKEPITALRRQYYPEEFENFDLRPPSIERKVLNSEIAIAALTDGGSLIAINTAHPYYKSLSTTFGANTKNGRKLINEFERLAISELTFEGYLYDLGLDERIIQEIFFWRDRQYRNLARTKSDSVHKLAEDLRKASASSSGANFEHTIVNILESMGFIATRDGASGQKDILMKASCGPESYILTFEAKAKLTGELQNDSAEIASAAAHRDAAKAEHAVVITRKFSGFNKNPEGLPAVLKECDAVGGVSIMETEALIKLAEVMNNYYYSLAHVKTIFTEVEAPVVKMQKIEALGEPFDHFDYKPLLNRIWKEQIRIGENESITYHNIWQEDYRHILKDKKIFEAKLQALSILADPLITLNIPASLIFLEQSPDKIMDLIISRLDRN